MGHVSPQAKLPASLLAGDPADLMPFKKQVQSLKAQVLNGGARLGRDRLIEAARGVVEMS